MPTKSKDNRIFVTLACTECKERNYTTSKKRKQDGGGQAARLELMKYCKRDRKHTLHRETR
jgi:large subunit ribosomal protein L33